MLGDVGQLDLVGGLGAELTLHDLVLKRLSGSAVQFTFLGKGRPNTTLGTHPYDPILADGDPTSGQFDGDESVAQGGVVCVVVVGSVDEVRVVPIAL